MQEPVLLQYLNTRLSGMRPYSIRIRDLRVYRFLFLLLLLVYLIRERMLFFSQKIPVFKPLPESETSLLLRRFFSNPAVTRFEVRLELGFPEQLAAAVFALVVFLCDGLLEINPGLESNETTLAAVRFFMIARQLPLDLQMFLCHRAACSMKISILGSEAESAFRFLASKFPRQSPALSSSV